MVKAMASTHYTDWQRIELLHACKWVDEVVVIPEYAVRLSFMDEHR